ncbi:MAG: 2'-5' RNA ligase family protein [Flavobacterium sp.]|nr:MAG: 2'-5' RNA ligase family protein [Flavobacterium sp.]
MRENFIKLLQDQPLFNGNNSATKLNIHIPIRGGLNNFCVDINQRISAVTNSGIDFSPKSFHVPHITLSMGFVRNEANFEEIMLRVFLFSQEIKPFEITTGNPYLKAPQLKYVFIDTDQAEMIIALKQKLESALGDLLEPLNWDVVNEPPHISLAYVKKDILLVKALLNNYQQSFTFSADAVELSYCGPLGTCVGTIRTFEFFRPNSLR